MSLPLPILPTQGQNPWFTERNNFDLAVKDELENRLSAAGIENTVGDITRTVDGSNLPLITGGTGNNTPILKAAIDALPDNWTLDIPKADYRLGSRLDISVDKSMRINFNGANLINDFSDYTFVMTGGYVDVQTVTSLTKTTIAVPGGGDTWISNPMSGVVVVMGGAPAWKKGDTLKIVADDPLIGQRDAGTPDENPDSQARYGQHMDIYSISGNTVTLIGDLREFDQYTTNIRIGLLPKHKVVIENLTMSIPPAQLDPEANRNSSGFRFMALHSPELRNVVVNSMQGGAITLHSCYRAVVDNPQINLTRNRPSNVAGTKIPNYGYGVYESGGEYSTIVNMYAGQIRHGYTDDSSRGIANRDLQYYGRTFGALITGGQVVGASAAAYDTHGHGDSARFVNVMAVNCYGGVNLRGMRHVVDGIVIRECNQGASVTDEDGLVQSFGHVISNVFIQNINTAILSNLRAGGPNAGVRDNRVNRWSNIIIRGATGHSIYCRTSTNEFENVRIAINANSTAAFGIVHATNSAKVTIKDITLDSSTMNDVIHPAFVSSGSELFVDGYQIQTGSLSSRFTAVLNSTGSSNTLINGTLDTYIPSSASALNVVSWVTPLAKNAGDRRGRRPGTIDVTSVTTLTQDISSMIADAQATTLVMNANLSTNQTLVKLPNGTADGQRLLICVTGTGTMTVQQGASLGNTALRGSVSASVAPNSEIELVWNGSIWVQTYAV